MLISRAVLTLTAAGAGLLLVDNWSRIVAVMALVAIATAAEVSLVSRWPAVARHPWLLLGGDLLVAGALLPLTDGGAAFFFYGTGWCALVGALLGGRALPLLAGQAVLGFIVAGRLLHEDRPTPTVAALIAALPMVGVLAGLGAGVAVSALVRYMDLAVGAVAAAQRSSAAAERARLARELHDSVAKTLRGVSFAAVALPSFLTRHPAMAEELASTVSSGAEAAAREARLLLEGLRADPLDRSFDQTVRLVCRGWTETTGVGVHVVADRLEPRVASRYELARILQEALANIERHARATHVRVRLVKVGEVAELSIADDGVGFTPRDVGSWQADGHFGIVGVPSGRA